MNRNGFRQRKPISLPIELKLFLFTSLAIWLVSAAFVAIHVSLNHEADHGLPPIYFSALFYDLNFLNGRLNLVHTPAFFTGDYRWIYPAPCFFLYKAILGWNKTQHVRHAALVGDLIYCGSVLVGLLVLAFKTISALCRRDLNLARSCTLVLGALLLSWPIFFSVHQGNIESILWMITATAVWAFYRDHLWTAAILIGLVGSFKIYPVLLLALYLAPRKYRAMAAGVLTFMAVTIFSLAYIGPTVPIALHNTVEGMKSFTELGFYPGAVDRNFLTFDHSLVSLIRVLTISHPECMLSLSHVYMPTLSIVMTIVFFTKVWKMPRLNQVWFILLAAVLLPPKSYDYTLTMLYIPMVWLSLLCVSAAVRGQKIPGALPVMIAMAFVLSPEVFIKFGGDWASGQFKTIVLLVLLGLTLRYPFSEEEAYSTTAIQQLSKK